MIKSNHLMAPNSALFSNQGGMIIMIIHKRHQNLFPEAFIFFHSWPNEEKMERTDHICMYLSSCITWDSASILPLRHYRLALISQILNLYHHVACRASNVYAPTT